MDAASNSRPSGWPFWLVAGQTRGTSPCSLAPSAATLFDAGFAQVDLYDIAEKDFPQRFVAGGYDVAFPALHGRYGEDGCIQGFLETLHIPYAFSGVLASAVATEKEFAKAVYRSAGIRAPRGFDMRPGTVLTEEQVDAVIQNLGLPLFVKPCGNGSSFGISRVNCREELAAAIELAGSAGQRVLVEECIEGTEITVPVIGNDEPEALPVVEIAYDAEFYDLKVKYEPSALHHIIPARLSPEVYALAQDMAFLPCPQGPWLPRLLSQRLHRHRRGRAHHPGDQHHPGHDRKQPPARFRPPRRHRVPAALHPLRRACPRGLRKRDRPFFSFRASKPAREPEVDT